MYDEILDSAFVFAGIVAEHLGSQLQLYLAYCCLILVELWSLSRMKVFVGYSRV